MCVCPEKTSEDNNCLFQNGRNPTGMDGIQSFCDDTSFLPLTCRFALHEERNLFSYLFLRMTDYSKNYSLSYILLLFILNIREIIIYHKSLSLQSLFIILVCVKFVCSKKSIFGLNFSSSFPCKSGSRARETTNYALFKLKV